MTRTATSQCANPAEKVPCVGPGDTWVSADGSTRPRNQVAGPASTSNPVPSATTSTFAPPTVKASPEDFTIAVKILDKQCFGSAGCNVRYRIEPKSTSLCLPSCTVLYEITGGEYVRNGSFRMEGGEATIKDSELIGTKNSKAALTAKVTEVLPN
ncbi:hypothetical protein [Amycolatopsis sp. NPDC058986]|uniref:hypothetical protein n=1 Tax=Amycolatopsis sp. NPDC058986 TaxID=3346685 RepID=UPI00366F3597